MKLCLDVGNAHIYGGVFETESEALILKFRHLSETLSSDQLGIFLKAVLRENEIDPQHIEHIGIASVVPPLDYSIRAACIKYFSINPFFLQSGIKTGLNIRYQSPHDVGADRVANAIAAISLFPNTPMMIIDFETATTFCMIDAQKNYLGGAILPGLRLSMEALSQKTAKLPLVSLVRCQNVVGRTLHESIQSGLYFGTLGAIKEIIHQSKQTLFKTKPLILATGSFASLFEEAQLYDHILPDLVLLGIQKAMAMNLNHQH